MHSLLWESFGDGSRQLENITHDPQQRNKSFKEFYDALYSSQINPSNADVAEFLNNINLPKLNDEQIVALDSPLSISEIHETLQYLPINKAPPGVFSAEFYKDSWPMLTPTFFKMVTQIQNKHQILSPNMNSAIISLLLKPSKNPAFPSSPVSLINTDLKILCKVLERKLEKQSLHS